MSEHVEGLPLLGSTNEREAETPREVVAEDGTVYTVQVNGTVRDAEGWMAPGRETALARALAAALHRAEEAERLLLDMPSMAWVEADCRARGMDGAADQCRVYARRVRDFLSQNRSSTEPSR